MNIIHWCEIDAILSGEKPPKKPHGKCVRCGWKRPTQKEIKKWRQEQIDSERRYGLCDSCGARSQLNRRDLCAACMIEVQDEEYRLGREYRQIRETTRSEMDL